MRTDIAPTISRQDYQAYPFELPRVALHFDLDANVTRVHARLEFKRIGSDTAPLVLNGQDLQLESIGVDGRALASSEYQLEEELLTIFTTPATFTLDIVTLCKPSENSTLMGLYVSGAHLFTQCEAEGFRRITWFPDRPDVMARYEVTLCADKERYPLLLSNGNLLHTEELSDGRHKAVWDDPHPKPSYLFAVVAGDFACREQNVRTRSGNQATLQVYSDHQSKAQTQWALDCLIRSLKWDEERFGLELDLDRFMIVAARDFNMGAMENKGLNVFNSAYVLADANSTTDTSYHAIEAVIGHEYFHNWTGNRVTCRDWFQLSLKEGLTVFRDQEFSADMLARGVAPSEAASARAVKRIDDVSTLRIAQFPEDAGPMAHPIRPESYQEISNFYTATIYEKGAEAIRMLHTLLGETAFQAGIQEYFRRHDGHAVTCDDFVDAMEWSYGQRYPGKDLKVFRQWYTQAGTPHVGVQLVYDPLGQSCRVTLTQRCEPAGIEKLKNPPVHKPPLHIPFAMGLLSQDGQPMPIFHGGESHSTIVLDLCQQEQSWTFTGIPSRPVPSLLRNFSAPVIVEYERPNNELVLLARHDTDPFARWEAGQELATRHMLDCVNAFQAGKAWPPADELVQTWRALILDTVLTPAYLTRTLTLPAKKELLEKTRPMDPVAVSAVHRQLHATLGAALGPMWLETYQGHNDVGSQYSPDSISSGRRALKNLALHFLASGGHAEANSLATRQYYKATNMTDRMGALSALVMFGDEELSAPALQHFYEQWQHDPLVVDRWFALQATSPNTTVESVRALMLHPAFSLRNPNRARSLVFQFCMNNMSGVHKPEGYAFWAEQVIALDKLNPEIAARLARAFDSWARYVPANRDPLHAALLRIQQYSTLSKNVAEIVSKALNI